MKAVQTFKKVGHVTHSRPLLT